MKSLMPLLLGSALISATPPAPVNKKQAKAPLTKKQKAQRAANKSAKISRKKNRKA